MHSAQLWVGAFSQNKHCSSAIGETLRGAESGDSERCCLGVIWIVPVSLSLSESSDDEASRGRRARRFLCSLKSSSSSSTVSLPARTRVLLEQQLLERKHARAVRSYQLREKDPSHRYRLPRLRRSQFAIRRSAARLRPVLLAPVMIPRLQQAAQRLQYRDNTEQEAIIGQSPSFAGGDSWTSTSKMSPCSSFSRISDHRNG